MKKLITFSFLSLFFFTTAYGQQLTQTVRGAVIDSDNKLGLPGVTIVILDSDPVIGTISDENGVFRLENVPISRISLQFSFIGYEPKTLSNIEVNSGKEVVLDISMTESTLKLEEVVVKANKKGEVTNDMTLIGARSISTEETKRYTGGMNDPARVVSSFAGVANSPNGSSDIIVRGNSPKYLQWYIDGMEITSPYHMDDQNASFGALTALNNNLLTTYDFYTGAFSPEFGNVLSSVMDVQLRKGNNEKFEGSVGLGLLGTDVTIEGPFKKGYAGSYLLNYRYSTVALINDIGAVDIPGVVNYQDATFKVILPTKNIGTFSAFGVFGLSGFLLENSTEVPGSSIQNAAIGKDFDKANFLSNLGIKHVITLNPNSYLRTCLSYSSSGIDDELYQGDLIKTFDSEGKFLHDTVINKRLTYLSSIVQSTYRSSVVYNLRFNARNKLQVGAKYTLANSKYNQSTLNYQTDLLENVTNFENSNSLLNNFVSWKHYFNDRVSVVAGLHNMNVFLNQKSTIEPRLAVNWKINDANSVSVGYGKHSNMERMHNYYAKVVQADGSIIEPNKNLELLKSDHYIVGYEKRFSDNFMMKLEFYYQHLYDLPVENVDSSYYATINEGIDYRYVALVNKGVGENYGIELTLERFFDGNFYFLINGSLFDSKYKSLENVWRNTQYNGNYLVNVLSGKEFTNIGKKQNQTIAINTRLFFSGGKRYIPLRRDAQGNVAVDPANNNYYDYSKAYDDIIDNIFQLNLSVSYKVNRQKVTHEIFLDLMNLTNNQARLSEYYDAAEPNGIGYTRMVQFFPNLMYKLYF